MRDLTPEEMANNQKGVAAYVVEARKHKRALAEAENGAG
jgi:hypothetical protein